MRVLAMVLAGGIGSRLHPLTAERSKPAVPFSGRYRIVDFVLSNLVNSDIHAIYMLVQYKSQSLIEHASHAWGLSHVFPGQFIAIVPPQMREGQEWFQGTADAIYQNINLIETHAPDMVAVFGADHIYRMDVRQMIDFHRDNNAHVSVAAIPVPLQQASDFGIIDADAKGLIKGFLEKPANPPSMAGDPTRAFASMGNYLFDTQVLLEALESAKQRGETDFGKHILPRMINTHRVFAYNFAQNRIPGIRTYEEAGYWRDVGTIDAYFAANQDTLGREPRFNLFNPRWFVNSSNYQGPSVRVNNGEIVNSTLGAGSLINGARIRNSIIRREVIIEPDVEIDDSIVMDYTVIRSGTRLKRVIVDRHNTLEAGTQIGFDAAADRARFRVSEGGIAVMAKGRHVFDVSGYY